MNERLHVNIIACMSHHRVLSEDRPATTRGQAETSIASPHRSQDLERQRTKNLASANERHHALPRLSGSTPAQ